jgi:hypothetical protein
MYFNEKKKEVFAFLYNSRDPSSQVGGWKKCSDLSREAKEDEPGGFRSTGFRVGLVRVHRIPSSSSGSPPSDSPKGGGGAGNTNSLEHVRFEALRKKFERSIKLCDKIWLKSVRFGACVKMDFGDGT